MTKRIPVFLVASLWVVSLLSLILRFRANLPVSLGSFSISSVFYCLLGLGMLRGFLIAFLVALIFSTALMFASLGVTALAHYYFDMSSPDFFLRVTLLRIPFALGAALFISVAAYLVKH